MEHRFFRLIVATLALATWFGPPVRAQGDPASVKAVQLIGLTGVKDNAKGTLRVDNGQLHFVHGKASSDIQAASIDDVVSGADSAKAVGKTIGTLSMAAPYGGGRFLSLFRKKIDTLTLKYRDAAGALHGAIFTMPAGSADGIKAELISQGAHTSVPNGPNTSDSQGGHSAAKEPKR